MSFRDDCSKSGILRSRWAKVRQSLRQAAIEVGLESSAEGELASLLAMESLPQSARSSPPRATSMQRAVSLPPGSPTAGTSTAPTPPPFPSRRTPSTGRSPPSTGRSPPSTGGRAPSTGHEAAKLDSNNNGVKRTSSPAPPQENRQEDVSYLVPIRTSHSFEANFRLKMLGVAVL